jgi:nucleotide-binding universal stress UspA family protein
MYKNILIPVVLGDSRDTQASFKAAQALADAGAQITLLHVIKPCQSMSRNTSRPILSPPPATQCKLHWTKW